MLHTQKDYRYAHRHDVCPQKGRACKHSNDNSRKLDNSLMNEQ